MFGGELCFYGQENCKLILIIKIEEGKNVKDTKKPRAFDFYTLCSILVQCFTNLSVHQNHLEGLLK